MRISPYANAFSLRHAAVAVALTLALWILPWTIFSSKPPTAPARSQKGALRVKYLRSARELDGTMWSPVLIPLPTKYGFSLKADRQGGMQNTTAALRPQGAESALMQTPPTPAATPGALPDTNPRNTALSLEPVEQPAYAGVVSMSGGEWRVESLDGLASRNFRAPALDAVKPPEGSGTWLSACASVELGADGRVEHVFLETSSGSTNVDQAVLRALRTGAGDPGGRVTSGRVRITRRAEEN